MGIKCQVPTAAQITELREKFNQKYASTPPAAPFHPVDMDRIRNDTLWLQRFLEMYDLDMAVCLDKLWETCSWRQSYGANELDESKLNSEYLQEGSVLIHGKDIDGKPLLIFRVKLHSKTKNLDDIIRIVIYWVERTQREQHLTQVTIFFDMAGTGLATMDLEFVKRIVETFKLYYPNCLNYILVYELAWVLNAAFKIVKALLPPKAVEILKMITKKDVTQYVTKDNCLVSWGGNDNYEYSFVPEQRRVPSTKSLKNAERASAANAGDEEPSQAAARKVHFAKSTPMRPYEGNNKYTELHTPGDNMLELEPSDYINFDTENSEASLKLKCVGPSPIAYKIQTTSPEKFRVRPRCGMLGPNESVDVGILLKSEHTLSSEARDKFLIMSTPMLNKDLEVAEIWRTKQNNDSDVEQHRLICRFKSKTDANNELAECSSKKIKMFDTPVDKTKKDIMNLYRVIYGIVLLLAVMACMLGYLLYDNFAARSPAPLCGGRSK